ncbi:Wzz/FepE/Etk N-terminal domain-containing protein [Kouleothrix sp.]|uniref:Wzz/FepE/Etk N-terminal domain-containing protein n=1 Tax=Kouleothrix sp. TaxID=2779161 RepID=UPI00391C0FB5
MELRQYFDILRRRWRLLALVPALVALLSIATALTQPARYGTAMRLLVTRDSQAPGQAGLSDRGEDTTAQDLPAIVQSSVFRADLAAALGQQGNEPGATLTASFSEHTVSIGILASSPAAASGTADAALALLREHGLRYWGVANAPGAQPGLNIGVLDPPGPPVRLNGLRAVALDAALRALLGLGAAAGLALLLHRLEHAPAPAR